MLRVSSLFTASQRLPRSQLGAHGDGVLAFGFTSGQRNAFDTGAGRRRQSQVLRGWGSIEIH